MIARHRGDLRVHSRWRPGSPGPASPTAPEPPVAKAQPVATDNLHTARRAPWRKITILLSGALLILAIAGAVRRTTDTTAPTQALPRTPAAWAEQFTAAALQDPTDVCHHLFAPALAAVFKGDTGKTCMSYYSRIDSRSYRIRHTLQDGPSAAIEGQELGYGRRFGYFTVLLTHLQSGWQAIDIVPGGSVRPR
jgi:hypothetical protein